MSKSSAFKIDAYSHIVPPEYKEYLRKMAPREYDTKVAICRALYDLDYRFQIMDKFGPIKQVLTLGWPSIESISDKNSAPELAKIANDGLAELVAKYPDRFIAAIAVLPINNIDASLKETDRTINELKFRGVYLYTPVNNQPLDSPEFLPLYEKMSQYDLPIYIHPMRDIDYPDYKTEKESKFKIHSALGWPFETTVAMARLAHSGVMEKYPNLKFVTHHCGGMVPYFADRIATFGMLGRLDAKRANLNQPENKKPVIEYYKRFYADTALYGNAPALDCGHAFFGPDHILFAADFPLGDPEGGYRNLKKTIDAIEEMHVNSTEKKKIYEDNARKLLHLV
jgi:predicted TIM-barrel fold metal-dependent hydrolase